MLKSKSPLFIAILWMIASIAITKVFSGYDIIAHNTLVISCIISYFLCGYTWVTSGNRITSVFIIFIIYAFFSNLGQSVLSLIPNIDDFVGLYRTYSYSAICNMLRFQLLCISALGLGCAITLNKPDNKIATIDLQNNYAGKNEGGGHLFVVEYVLFISMTVMFYIAIRQLVLRQTMSYHDMYDMQIRGGFSRFASITFGLYCLFNKKHVKFIIFSWLFLLFAFMVTGTRSVGIPYFGALFISFPVIFPRLMTKKYILGWILVFIFGFSFLSVLSNLRTSSFGTISTDVQWWMAFLGTIDEMGGSARPAIETISVIKEGEHMLTIPYAILQIFIPSAILDTILPQSWTVALGSWINTLHADDNEWGFSFIAEAYANFGKMGWLFMVLYGYLISKLEIKSYRKIINGDYLYAACFLAILCRQIFYARGQIQLGIDFFRPAFYVFILWLIFGIRNNNSYKLKV